MPIEPSVAVFQREEILHVTFEDRGHLKGEFHRRVELPRLDSHDGLPAHGKDVRELLLGQAFPDTLELDRVPHRLTS